MQTRGDHLQANGNPAEEWKNSLKSSNFLEFQKYTLSNTNNIAELYEVNDKLMPKPQEIALHTTQKIPESFSIAETVFIQNFL